jgi:two-component system, LytTR family, response regulator
MTEAYASAPLGHSLPVTVKWRVLVADDEPLARLRIRSLLSHFAQFEVVAECADGVETLAALSEYRPDVLFLDVRMPELDGIAVAETIARSGADGVGPAIVFVTAYDVHAVNAFDLDAIDYLVKPVDIDRFSRTLERVESRLAGQQPQDATKAIAALNAALLKLNELQIGSGHAKRFVIRSLSGVSFVESSDIDRIQADGNYVALWTRGRRQLLRESMNGVLQRLDPAEFLRVHRSAIVPINKIRHIEPCGHGEYIITLSDGTKVESSRTYRTPIQELMR